MLASWQSRMGLAILQKHNTQKKRSPKQRLSRASSQSEFIFFYQFCDAAFSHECRYLYSRYYFFNAVVYHFVTCTIARLQIIAFFSAFKVFFPDKCVKCPPKDQECGCSWLKFQKRELSLFHGRFQRNPRNSPGMGSRRNVSASLYVNMADKQGKIHIFFCLIFTFKPVTESDL